MKRVTLAVPILCGLLLASSPVRAADLLPRPAALEPDVRFWVRIYSEVDTQGGLIHDARDLGVVYEVVRFPTGASSRSRERQVERSKKHIAAALRKLAAGRRSGLSDEERRILALFPADVGSRTLATAAGQVRFQLGQADKFRAGLVRSGAWRDYIRTTFHEMGLPPELAALPHVESSFTPSVYSRVGAAGLWQFTRSTGRRYMRVDHVVDERLDPFQATRAAGRLLEANKLITGTWPLALTSYNHGASGMRRASKKLGTTDITTIVRKYKSRTFGFASRNFYVEFLAALEVDTHSNRYFGPLILDAPIDYEISEVGYFANARSLASAIGVPTATLQDANPALSRLVWSGEKFVPRGFPLRVPRSALSRPLIDSIDAMPPDQRYAAQTPDSTHRVRRGDTLSGIAARYGTSVRAITSLNKLRSKHRIHVGQKLRLPYSGRAPRSVVSSSPPANGLYTVRRGDTLSKIARRFGMSEQQLAASNELRNRHRIYPGQSLRVVATAEPAEPPAPKSATTVASAATPKATADTVEATADTVEATAEAAREPEPLVAAASEPPAAIELAAVALEAALAVMDREPVEPEAIDSEVIEAEGVESEAEGIRDEVAEIAVDSDASAAGPDAMDAQELERELLADPSDYSVAEDGTIEVQSSETLGHIAEWLDVRASQLRSRNSLRYGQPLAVHKRLELDFDRVTPAEFERRRLEHHRALQAEFFERFEISGTRSHVVRRGDSVWVLSRRSQVPLWLLRQYNPDVDFGSLNAGARITVPVVRPHGSRA